MNKKFNAMKFFYVNYSYVEISWSTLTTNWTVAMLYILYTHVPTNQQLILLSNEMLITFFHHKKQRKKLNCIIIGL